MFYNYFKIAVRLLQRNKMISAINLLGLAIALAGSLLIAVFINDELSYDRHHENSDRIYRVTRDFLSADGSVSLHLGHVAPPFGPLLKNDFPDFLEVARTRDFFGTFSVLNEDGTFREALDIENPFLAEPEIFKIFTIPVISGDAETGISKPFTMMVSDEAANHYFGSLDIVGDVVDVMGRQVEITGIYEAFPPQSHWHPDVLIAFNTLEDENIYGKNQLETNFGNNSFPTYVLAKEDMDPDYIESQFPDFLNRHMGNAESEFQPSDWTHLFLQPVTSIHLHSHLDSEIEANSNINYVITLGAIGLFLIVIACFNFINLSTARATTRSKEVGLRKVIGAQKNQLVSQYLSESILMAILSMALASLMVYFCLPWLNEFTSKSIPFDAFLDTEIVLFSVILVLVVGILAGLYPAVVISGFKPATILKGNKSNPSAGGVGIRKVLVVLQFTISIALIAATLITLQQLSYMNNYELGYEKDQVFTIPYYGEVEERYETFHTELVKEPFILKAARSSRYPTDRLLDSQGTSIEQGDSLVATSIVLKDIKIDEEFLETYQIPLLSGRNLSKEIRTDDSASFIINEAALKMVGWDVENAVGQVLQNGSVKGHVVGVVKDFHFESLHEPIVPMVFHGENNFNSVSILINGKLASEALAHTETLWKQFMGDVPFSYSFLNERYERLYLMEQKINELFIIFSSMAIIIAALGLFGLATFNTSMKLKEISIRKVLGAPVLSILKLLSKEILILVIIANLIAWPLAWYFMDMWLDRFAYHIDLSILTFIGAGLIALLVTLITISSQSLKAALSNPATILRND